MAVVIETTLGDITVDLYLDQRPVTCLNFLKLCKMKYYNYNLFHTIRSGFIAQTGDPTGEGSGGQSVFGLLEGPDKRFFSGEKMPKIRHTDAGLISMVGTGDMMVGSQFFFTLAPDLDSLDGVHCVIGEVTDGHDVLRKLNDVICDEGHRPYRDVRITHTVVLEDPFNDPHGLRAPSRSPSPSVERLKGGRIAPDEEIDETQGKSAAEVQEMIEEKEAKARATILEIVGDLPDADIAPPENVLFVCKLNPVTTDDDLEIIFSRFGKIVSCEVIRDKKSGDSLQYAFIEFGDKKSCEDAYFKMDNVLIDDRRIHVDFSQSVSKMKWLGKGRGVKYFNESEVKEREKVNHLRNDNSKRSRSREREHKNHHNDRNHYNNNKRSDDREKERDREIRSDRHHRRDKEYNQRVVEKSNRKRSRSRSKLDRSRNDRSNHVNDNNTSRNSETHIREYKHNSTRHENNKNRDNNTHRSRSSPSRNRRSETSRDHRSRHEKNEKNSEKDVENNKAIQKNDKKSEKDVENKKAKQKNEHSETVKNKRSKNGQDTIEPRTPSPSVNKKKGKAKSKHGEKKIDKGKRNANKKKRKPSTSSESSSESSSSSSETSSSSEEDRKKKSLKRRKKKYSTSSTSSSSESSSSSTSSSESSSSSSSSSDDSKKKKSRKHPNKKKKL